MDTDPRQHPVYPELVARYRAALMGWANYGVQQCAAMFGHSRRAYCDQFVGLVGMSWPMAWSSNTTSDSELTQEHYEAAYREACKDAGLVS